MHSRIDIDGVNFLWVLSGSLFCLATSLGSAARDVSWGGMLPTIFASGGLVLLGLSSDTLRSIVGGRPWGRGVIFLAAVWIILHDGIRDLLWMTSSRPDMATSIVALLDVAFAFLVLEEVRRGRVLDRKVWCTGAIVIAVVRIAQLIPPILYAADLHGVDLTVATGYGSAASTVGVTILGVLLILAGAGQEFRPTLKSE